MKMKLNIQQFGGRGASSSVRTSGGGSGSSKASISDLRKQEQNIRNQMTNIYNQNSGFARTDIKSVSDAREKWYSLQKKANDLRDKIAKEESKMTKNTTSVGTKNFVNSYGKATTRNITNSTYKRAQRRTQRAVERNLGIR